MCLLVNRCFCPKCSDNVHSSMSDKTFHIVVRFSDNLFSVGDVVAKHNKVVSQVGFVWFGKIGQTISQNRIDLLNDQINRGITTFVYLVKGNRKKSTFYQAIVLSIAKDVPKDETNAIPNYYEENDLIQYMKTWIKVSEITSIEPSSISNLKTIGSVFPLQETLVRSSSGYFFVHETKKPLY